MSRRAWFPLYISDYLGDTRALTAEQHGAYLLILFDLYQQGGEIPSDEAYLRKITGLSKHKFPKVWQIISKYFENNLQKLSHRRVSKQLIKQADRAPQASEKARKAGNARWGVDPCWPDMTDA